MIRGFAGRPAAVLVGAIAAVFAGSEVATGQETGRAQEQTEEIRLGIMESALEAARQDLIDIRRDIHRHPELSGQERRTAALVADRLRALGLEVETGVGGHGVVGVLRGGLPGPVVAYRAGLAPPGSSLPGNNDQLDHHLD